jgi:hypothetical protein
MQVYLFRIMLMQILRDANIKGFGRYSHTIFDAILQILRSLEDIIMFLPYTVLNSWYNSANIKGFGRYHYVTAVFFVNVFISYFLSNQRKKILDAILQILRDLEDIIMLLPYFFVNGFISYFISNQIKIIFFSLVLIILN